MADQVPAEFDCGARQLALQFATSLLPSGSGSIEEVADALRLQECGKLPRLPQLPQHQQRSTPKPTEIEVYVSPTGKDSNDGSISAPLPSLQGARDRIRQIRLGTIEQNATVVLRAGIYHLHKPLTLSPEDSFVHYTAMAGEEVVVSGGLPLDLEFVPVNDTAATGRAR